MKDISKELQEFKEFKKNYKFEQKEIEEIDGIKYCDGISLIDEDGEELGDCEKWINVGYKLKGPHAKVLSNLFPYKFEFKGKQLSSIESFFQGAKFKDVEMQNYVLEYSGLDSNRIKVASDYNWRITGELYWQGKPVDRFSKEYDDLLDELYISAIQNPLYRNVLKKCDRYILHAMGETEKTETVFTRYEFERQLNCLKDFLKNRD
jgi:hypothetical protein